MGFTENYLALRNKQKPDTQKKDGTGAGAGNNFTSRYLALRKEQEEKNEPPKLRLPDLPIASAGAGGAARASAPAGGEPVKGLSLPALPTTPAGTAQEPQGLSLPEIQVTSGNLMPEWAQRMVDRYKPENNQNIRQNPVAAAEEKKRQASAEKGVDWRGIHMGQSPDGVRSQGQEGQTAADWGELAKQTALAGVGQVSKAAGATLSAAEQLVTRPLGWLLGNPELYKDGVMYVINKNATNAAAQVNENLSRAAEKTGKAGELVAKFGPATVAALPQAALAYLTAGQSLAAQTSTAGLQAASTAAQLTGGAALANTALEAVKSMAANPSFQYSFMNTVGGEYEQALEDGADVKTAYAYATITALMNSAVEIGGEGGIDKLPEKDKRLLLEWVKDMFDEGKEEVVQGAISQLMQNTVYQKGNPVFSMTDEEAIINPGRMAEDFAGGAVVGGILGGGQLAVNAAIDSQAQKNTAPTGAETIIDAPTAIKTGVTAENGVTGAAGASREIRASTSDGTSALPGDLETAVNAGTSSAVNSTDKNSIPQAEADVNRGPEGLPLPAIETENQTGEDQDVRKTVSLKEGQTADAAQPGNRGGFSADGQDVSRADRRLLENIGKVTGSDIRVVPQAELDRIAGRSGANGAQNGDRLYISESADRPMVEVAKHELTHRLQDIAPAEYGAFRDYVTELYRADGTLEQYIDGMIRSRKSAGVTLTQEQALDEIAADYAGELLVDEKAVRRLAGENRGLLEKLLDGLREFIEKIRRKFGGGQTAELERAAKLWQDALEAAGRSTEGSPEARSTTGPDQGIRKAIALKEGPTESKTAESAGRPEGLKLPSVEDSSETGMGAAEIPGDPDADRYSSKGDAELKKEIDRLRRQNQRLKEQMKRTDIPRRNREAVARKARELISNYSTDYDSKTLTDRLQTLWDHLDYSQ